MKKTLFRPTLITLCILSFLNSCKKTDFNNEDLTESYKAILIAQGFDITGLIEQGDYIVVEGDIRIAKSALRTSERQAAVSATAPISAFNQTDITIFVNNTIPTGGVDDWRADLVTAVNAYNNVANTNIRLRIVNSAPADITVVSDNGALGPLVIADALFPSAGKAGNTIRINLDFNNNINVPAAQKAYNLVHEIAHTLGFRHTNWAAVDPPGSPIPVAVGISPNAGANPDPASVMNGATAGNLWVGFSAWDVYAVQTLYPRLPFSVTINGGSEVPDSYLLHSGQYITVSALTSAKGSTYSWSVSGGYPYGSTTGFSATGVVGNPNSFGMGVTATSPFGATAYDSSVSWD